MPASAGTYLFLTLDGQDTLCLVCRHVALFHLMFKRFLVLPCPTRIFYYTETDLVY